MPITLCDKSNINQIIDTFLDMDLTIFHPEKCIDCNMDIAFEIINICPYAYFYLPDKIRRSQNFKKIFINNFNVLKLHFEEHLNYIKNNIQFYIEYEKYIENPKEYIENPEEYETEILNIPKINYDNSDFIKYAIDAIDSTVIFDKVHILWLFSIINNNSDMKIYLEKSKIFFEIIKYYSYAFNFVSSSNKQNINYISNILLNNGLVIKYIDSDILNSYIVELAVSQNGLALKYAPDYKNESRIVFNAISQNGLALEFASDNFKDNSHIVFTAVNQNGLALEFASDNIKDNIQIVEIAIVQNINAFKYANINCVLELLKYNCSLYNYISPKFKENSGFISEALYANGLLLEFLSEEQKDNKSIVITAFTYKPESLKFASKRQVINILENNGMALQYVSNNFKNEFDIVLPAFENDEKSIIYASPNMQHFFKNIKL
jgi:hypothetical protein